eukprot:CAMPEP_0176319480 /NCGR_PEP_ID=MMETSP0121_2-20121125/70323_1 /TAXON_ID=160619 /ORGANISM="Kryptoperidinium foliaceum, Strain CCMP 1326" /LENGTH=238 /DNA_ID=CAMNT_0017661829 /DNA_START=1 /DNA_END=716 /DNA_ORIENTATION=-
MPGGGCQERQQHGDAGEHRESGRGAGRRDEAAAGMQPLDDEISFISDMAQSTPLEYSECSSIRVPAPGASIADSATSSEAPSGASERGGSRWGPHPEGPAPSTTRSRLSEALPIIGQQQRGPLPRRGDLSAPPVAPPPCGGHGPRACRRGAARRGAAPTSARFTATATTAGLANDAQAAAAEAPPRVGIDVTCCPCGSGVAATDIAGGGSGFGAAPTANAEAEEELVATPAGLWMSPA